MALKNVFTLPASLGVAVQTATRESTAFPSGTWEPGLTAAAICNKFVRYQRDSNPKPIKQGIDHVYADYQTPLRQQ